MTMTASSVGRIGGLAAALGIGAAVATGLAASASAAPTDGERSAVSSARAVSGDSGVARSETSRGPRRAATGRDSETIAKPAAAAVRAAASVAVSASAATDSTPVRPARRALQRASVSAPVVAAGEVASVATVPVTAASAFNPISGIIDALRQLFCDPRGRRITIYLGTHFAIPNNFGFFIRDVTGTGTFTANSTYDLGDSDQYDWNKFTGIAFTPLEPDRNSVMVGWRYNLTSQEFEIAPFYNVDKVRILPTPQDIISVPVDQTFQYHVDYDGVTLTYGDTTVVKAFPEGLTPNVWTAARVSGWFGGNRAAPRTISYFLKID